ncbi:MAG: DEAD/DEAH box helicase [Firmicutes bacterium]|nr:DEAD/DEAH box helicase [Bacillota bacterium]
MDYSKHNLKIKYRSSEDDIVKDFFIPTFKATKLYKRAVGYFSSSSLITVSRGITNLLKNKGKMQLIASPELQKDDIEAVNKGYKARKEVLENTLINSFNEPKNYFEEERLNLLAHLISRGTLDIKIAFMENEGKLGLYHEKIGVMYDFNENKIAFTGSLNESSNAFTENFESIDVYYSWKGEDNLERINEKEKDFDALWYDHTKKIKVVEFPKIALEKLNSYKKKNVDFEIDKKQFYAPVEEKIEKKKYPKLPNKIQLYDYQKKAVKEWENNNFKGIFSMATGTGKTITGLAAVARLSRKLSHNLAVLIICPYQHLVEQWVEDIKNFNMDPIIGYSTSSQKNWKKRLKDSVIDYNLNIINHFCFVTTNATYSSEFVQKQINKIKNSVVIVIDEAHNFGASNLSKKLNYNIPYRLALSATLERYRDPEGTKKLYNYFDKECIKYPLHKAIKEEKLTPYNYYPVLTWLTNEELIEYRRLSKQLAKCFDKRKGKRVLNEKGKKLAIKRARLVAGSVNKLSALKNRIRDYKESSYILVYCGATTVSDPDYKYGEAEKSELRQIEAVASILGNELGMKVSQFTSEEDSKEREKIKKEFSKGKNLQALVAIRCLDEGVNIPDIRTAFILASSTNPKEYIQRRGRVLRISEGKKYSEIFDFITVPRPLENVKNLNESEIKGDVSLVKKEIERMEDFAEISENPQDSYKLINHLKEVYDLDKITWGDKYE